MKKLSYTIATAFISLSLVATSASAYTVKKKDKKKINKIIKRENPKQGARFWCNGLTVVGSKNKVTAGVHKRCENIVNITFPGKNFSYDKNLALNEYCSKKLTKRVKQLCFPKDF